MGKYSPTKFLCCFSLRTGSIFAAILMLIITLVCIIVIAIDAVQIEKTVDIYVGVWKTAYSYIVTTIFFCLFVFIVNIWFIWGVCHKKASVVISWVVVQGIFLLYLFCALLIMLILFKNSVGLVSWILAFVFFLVFMAFMIYLVIIGLEYWREIKHREIVISS